MIFFQLVAFCNIYFMGHADDPDLMAGVGLGNMLLNVCIFSISQGMASTIETFVGWSYGSEKYSECGLHLNRARLMLLVILAPVILLFFNVDTILV